MPRNKGRTSQNRKILSFFRVNFAYLPPYHVLCDGDIIHQCLNRDLYLKQSLPDILNASAQPVITNCVLEDLRSRGSEYSNAALFAKRATRLPCDHDEKLEPSQCLLHMLRTASEKKLLIAAANVDLLKQLAHIPGIPLISIFNQTKLVLRPPNKITLSYVRDNERIKTQTISQTDKSLLERIKADERAKIPAKTTIRKKRKAKGPNPLSVKKSTKHSKKRADDSTCNNGQDSGKSQQSFHAIHTVEKGMFPDSVLEQPHAENNGKRKRGRRRAANKQNGVDEGERSSSPKKARPKSRMPISASITSEDQLNKGRKGRAEQNKGSPGAMVSFGVEISGNKTLSQVPREGEQSTNFESRLEGTDANELTPKSTTQDETVPDESEQNVGKETNDCYQAVQLNLSGDALPNKRKKQRKNRRRRPTKKQ